MKKLILSTLLMAGIASAADQAMIVFDASGSMWGRVDGKEKITIAKDALKQVVGQWNPKTQLGLMAYGHRTKGDCSDIEVLVPIGGFDKQSLLSKVKSISPKGKTPISRSLKQAANSLRYTEDKATVILISDGKETCDADPCATAKELEAQGIDFVTHVIGFNVDKDTDAQLSCVAEATGGRYFSAKNAKALNDAMKTVVHTVQKIEPKPKPKPKPKLSSKYNLRIKAFETEGGKQIKAEHTIYKPIDEDNSKNITWCYSYSDKTCKQRLPVGEYFLISKYNYFTIKTPFTITAGQPVNLNVIMGQTGKVKITAFETEGGKQVKAEHTIYKPIDEDNSKNMTWCYSYNDKTCKQRLPVGEYFLISKYNYFTIKTPFTITAGKYTDVNVIMGQTGKVKITAFETEGGKQVKAEHTIYKPIDEDNSKNMTWCYSYTDKTCKQRLPVGEYFLVSKYNYFTIKTPFTITAGKYTDVNVIIGQTGKVKITAFETEGGKQVKAEHTIYKPIDEDNSKNMTWCYSYTDKTCKQRLPVGEYFLVSKYNYFTIKTPFTITAGKYTDVNVIIGQTGKVKITAFETEGGKQVKAEHTIYKPIDEDNSKNMTWCYSYTDKACKQRLPANKYFLISKYGDFKLKTPFTITAGKTTELSINFEPIHISAVGMNACTPVTFTVIDAEGATVATKRAAASVGVDFLLAAGKYRIEADNDSGTKTIAIDTSNTDKAFQIDFGGKAGVQTIEGYWKTKPSQGQAQIQLNGTNVQGTYAEDNGRVFGDYNAASKTFTGYWVEDGSDQKCDTEKDGSYHWGRTVWHFDKTLCTFKGAWGYCGKKPSHDWTGSYLKPLKQATIDKQSLIDADKDSSQASSTPKTDSQTIAVTATDSTASNSVKATVGQDETAQALAMMGALAKAVKNVEKSVEKSTEQSTQHSIKESNTNAGVDNTQTTTASKDKTEAQAKAVMGLVQAFASEEEAKELQQGLQMLTGLNENLSGGVLGIYKQAITAGLPFMEAAQSCYQDSDTLAQAQACDHLAKQAADAVAKKMENVVGIKPDVSEAKKHTQWDAAIKQQTVTELQTDIKEAKITLVCIDNGVTILEMDKCIKAGGKVAKKAPPTSKEDKTIQQVGNLLRMLGN